MNAAEFLESRPDQDRYQRLLNNLRAAGGDLFREGNPAAPLAHLPADEQTAVRELIAVCRRFSRFFADLENCDAAVNFKPTVRVPSPPAQVPSSGRPKRKA